MRLPPAATSPRWRLSKKGQQAAPVRKCKPRWGSGRRDSRAALIEGLGGVRWLNFLSWARRSLPSSILTRRWRSANWRRSVALRRGVLKGCRSPNAQPLPGLNREEKKLFDDQQMVVAARPRAAAVEFTADLPGWLWIDGRYRGVAPLRVSDLSSGRHFFTFVVPGGEASVSWREPDWPGTGHCR